MTMGEKIMKLRKARGWNQEELAERIGVTRQAVSRWESDSAKPDADKIVLLCDLFGISADYLLREQYAGEGAFFREPVIVQEQVPVQGKGSEDTLKEKRSKVIGSKQVLGFALFALGWILLFAMALVGVMEPHTLYTDHGTYYGFQAYVRVYHMEWMLWTLGSMIGGGMLLMTWDWFWRFLSKKIRKKKADTE